MGARDLADERFSKKVQNLEHAVTLHFMHCNFYRIHSSLRVIPAIERARPIPFGGLEEVVALT
jgi:hypothetical protein